jgi:hypothetical protein
MIDSWIYSRFSDTLSWISRKHSQELDMFPREISSIADYYLKKRLLILTQEPVKVDPRLGDPLPFLALWFADSFGLSNKLLVNKLALTLSYAAIIVSVRDDLIDGRAVIDGRMGSEHAYIATANFYYDKYYDIFKAVFPPESIFWSILCNCLNEWSQYETWSFIFNRGAKKIFNPLSRKFLVNSSRYLVAITFPTIAAIAILTENQLKLDRIRKFLTDYYAGFRIADDLRDWPEDLNAPNYNHSSVIYSMLSKRIPNQNFDTVSALNMFLNKDFLLRIYGTVINLYQAAKKDIAAFKSRYLEEFMDTQIEFYTDARHIALDRRIQFNRSLIKILSSRTN